MNFFNFRKKKTDAVDFEPHYRLMLELLFYQTFPSNKENVSELREKLNHFIGSHRPSEIDKIIFDLVKSYSVIDPLVVEPDKGQTTINPLLVNKFIEYIKRTDGRRAI